MADFAQSLRRYVAGTLEGDALLPALRHHLASRPSAAAGLEALIRDAFRRGTLPASLHDLLLTVLSDVAAGPGKTRVLRHRVSTADVLSGVNPQSSGSDDTRVAPRKQIRSAASVTIGTVLKDRFVLEAELGRGGMSVVYKARDRRKEEARDREPYVAIKVLNASASEIPEAFVLLQREAKKAQSLAHPNIGTVFDFDRDGDIVYICMEYLSGQSLDYLIAHQHSSGLTYEDALPIITGMAGGLGYAHRRGIVHADFKPSNVFVTDAGETKVFDFGIARAVVAPGRDTPRTLFDPRSLNALTPAYASCEMIERLDADPRDDIYGLACVSYELLTGRHPFDRKPATQARALGLRPAPVAGLSSAQNRALARGLAFDRSDRAESADVFLQQLAGRKKSQIKNAAFVVALAAAATTVGVFLLRPETTSEHSQPVVTEPEKPVPVDADTQQRIERFLVIAHSHLSVDRLVQPPDASAAAVYAAVLELQPGNPDALAGLAEVEARLIKRARQQINFGKLDEAELTVERGLEFLPDSQALQDTLRDLGAR